MMQRDAITSDGMREEREAVVRHLRPVHPLICQLISASADVKVRPLSHQPLSVPSPDHELRLLGLDLRQAPQG